MQKSILEPIGSEQPRLGMSRVWKLGGKASPSFPLDSWFLSAVQTAWPSSSILTNGKCLYDIIPVPWWHICGQGKLPREAPMPSRVVVFWYIWRSGQQYSVTVRRESSVLSGSPAILLTCLPLGFKRFRQWNQRRRGVCFKIGAVRSSHWWNFVSLFWIFIFL